MSYRTNRHSCYDLEYHLVVVTKYRHPVIDGAFKDRLTELTYRIFEENFQCYVNEVNTDKDHIHILFEAPPQVALSSLVCSYKTVTARLLRKEFAEYLAPFYWKPYLWNRSYFVCTVSERSHELITEYIRNQRNKEKGYYRWNTDLANGTSADSGRLLSVTDLQQEKTVWNLFI